jgi:hypothetical protein
MAKFSAINVDDEPGAAAYAVDREVSGVVWSKMLSPDDFSLWLAVSELDDGATLRWATDHGDEAVCVLQGALAVDGRVCPTGGALIVESAARAAARARGRTVVAHYGPRDEHPPSDGLYGAPEPDGHTIHVVGDRGWFASGGGEFNRAVWWADSTCPTCRISVFHVYSSGLDERGVAHHHTQDEIIFITSGAVRMGARRFGAGTALSIPANMRYAIAGDGSPRSFLNYRRDASLVALTDGSAAKVESGLTFSGTEVRDFR